MNDRPVQFWLFAFLLAGLSITFAGHGSFVDENLIMQVTDSIAQRGSLEAMPGFQALEAPDGKYYSRYGIAFPVIMLPWYYLGEVLFWLFGHHAVFFKGSHFFACLWGSLFITALTGVLFYRVCRLIGGEQAASAALSIVLIWGTSFWPYSQTLFRLTTTTAILLILLECILRHQQQARWLHLVGIALCAMVGVNLREDIVIAFAFLGLFAIAMGSVQERGARASAFWVGGLLGVAIWGWHNYVRFGTFFIENYADLEFNYPLLISVPNLLWGWGRGLLPYSPLCLLLVFSFRSAKKHRELLLWCTCFGIVIAYLLLYAKSHMWHGGRCWGPRHLYYLLPFCMLPGVRLLANDQHWGWKAFAAAAFVWGMLYNWPGVYAHTGAYQSFASAPGFFELLMRPIGHPDYITFDDLDLWWVRMVRMYPYSLWPVAFAGLIGLTLYCGWRLWNSFKQQA
ncbi:MAG: hypothetical protein P9L94_10755 [Candidatus Hinthialibacter antarcticus]|nr:hypothetical protein [Candidatus Hinthialibacter antarcticus]